MIRRFIRNVFVLVPVLCAFGVMAADSKAQPAKDVGFSGGISEIAARLGEIDKRLVGIDKSVQGMKGIEKSADELNVSVAQIAAMLSGDVILVRGAMLILFATACAGGLIVLQARLRSWKPGAK